MLFKDDCLLLFSNGSINAWLLFLVHHDVVPARTITMKYIILTVLLLTLEKLTVFHDI